jgi:L-asparaginase II
VESVHEVAACAIGADGSVAFSTGDIEKPVYLRSTAKPFIAAAAIAAGVREKFEIQPHEIAVMAASHTGEPFHVPAARSILYKIGLDESALQCGAHLPYNAEAAADLQRRGIEPTPIYNNCSGKHAGILALCKAIGADTATYLRADNPAEQRILDLCARVSGEQPGTMPLGIDGCGIPVYATSLRNAATSFMRLATLEGLSEEDVFALRIVRDAMIAHPEYVSGTDEFDTVLMQSAKGALACKSGAEGVHGTAVIDRGGLVVKVLDGTSRARGPAVLSILRSLGWVSETTLREMHAFERPQLQNRAGTHVGEVRAVG